MKIPHQCPSCGKKMVIARMHCGDCSAVVEGAFDVCPVCRLDPELRTLFDLFMACRGNLKDVQRALGVSYPTTRNKIEEMFQRYNELKPPRKSPIEILKLVRQGTITSAEAEAQLKTGE